MCIRDRLEGLRAPKDYPGPGSGSVSFVISPGDTGGAIGQRLQAADIVLTSGAFVEAFTADPKAAGIQPGSYTLKKQMKASDALTALLDPANRSVPRVTIREGMWVSEVFAALSKGTATPPVSYTHLDVYKRQVRDGEVVSNAVAGDSVELVLDRTPFYAEGGGQLADGGRIVLAGGAVVEVDDVQKPIGGLVVHLSLIHI